MNVRPFLRPSALGAASGSLAGYLKDVGLDDRWMKETAEAIKPGTDKVLGGLKGEGGTVLKTSLDHTKEAAVQAALAGVQAAVPSSSAAATRALWRNGRGTDPRLQLAERQLMGLSLSQKARLSF